MPYRPYDPTGVPEEDYVNQDDLFRVRLYVDLNEGFDLPIHRLTGTATINVWAGDGDEAEVIATGLFTGTSTVYVIDVEKVEED